MASLVLSWAAVTLAHQVYGGPRCVQQSSHSGVAATHCKVQVGRYAILAGSAGRPLLLFAHSSHQHHPPTWDQAVAGAGPANSRHATPVGRGDGAGSMTSSSAVVVRADGVDDNDETGCVDLLPCLPSTTMIWLALPGALV